MFLLLNQLPKLLVEWDRYLGPAILLQAYRWLADSRDEATGERLDNQRSVPSIPLSYHYELHQGVPKGFEPRAIAEIKNDGGRQG